MSELEPFETKPRSSFRRDLLVYAVQFGILFAFAKLTPFWALVAGPNGEPIPTSAPDEGNRVYHPLGFSVVAPNDWNVRVYLNDDGGWPGDSLGLTPKSGIPRRYWGSSIGIHRHDTKPKEIADFKETTFQGEAALERKSTRGSGGFEDPSQFHYDLIFERDGSWYWVTFHVFAEINELPEGIRQYLESFKTHRHQPKNPEA